MTDHDALHMWTVYDHPTDYPDSYVARLFVLRDGEARPCASVIVSADLEVLRTIMLTEMRLSCIPRFAQDDGKIVEVWL